GLVRSVRLHLEEVPDRRPESRQIVDRPAPQVFVGREREPPLTLEPGEVAADLGRLADVRRRRPEDARVVAGLRAHQGGGARCPMLYEISRAALVTDGPKRAI